jgi:N-acetylglutamate synthase-like GNAT family acetyltransferase
MPTSPQEDQPRLEIRPAVAGDSPAIRELIRAVHINPLGLDWKRFIIAVDPVGRLIACGQVKPHQDGSLELASIAVIPERRNQGIASAIIRRLIQSHPGPLYLTCRTNLENFYVKFGFRALGQEEMPAYFRRIARIVRIARALKLVPGDLLVMKRDG